MFLLEEWEEAVVSAVAAGGKAPAGRSQPGLGGGGRNLLGTGGGQIWQCLRTGMSTGLCVVPGYHSTVLSFPPLQQRKLFHFQ